MIFSLILFLKKTELKLLQFVTVALLLITILFCNEARQFATLIFHNVGMLIYSNEIMSLLPNQKKLKISSEFLSYHFDHDYSLIKRARYISVLHSIKSKDNKIPRRVPEFSHEFQNFNCSSDEYKLLRIISQPVKIQESFFSPVYLIYFHKNKDATSEINFKRLGDIHNKCGAELSVNYEQSPQRYVLIRQIIKVEENRNYLLRGRVFAHNIQSAWLGISSQWTGHQINKQDEWHEVFFVFHTEHGQFTETIQLVIEAGKGMLQITDVSIRQLSNEYYN